MSARLSLRVRADTVFWRATDISCSLSLSLSRAFGSLERSSPIGSWKGRDTEKTRCTLDTVSSGFRPRCGRLDAPPTRVVSQARVELGTIPCGLLGREVPNALESTGLRRLPISLLIVLRLSRDSSTYTTLKNLAQVSTSLCSDCGSVALSKRRLSLPCARARETPALYMRGARFRERGGIFVRPSFGRDVWRFQISRDPRPLSGGESGTQRRCYSVPPVESRETAAHGATADDGATKAALSSWDEFIAKQAREAASRDVTHRPGVSFALSPFEALRRHLHGPYSLSLSLSHASHGRHKAPTRERERERERNRMRRARARRPPSRLLWSRARRSLSRSRLPRSRLRHLLWPHSPLSRWRSSRCSWRRARDRRLRPKSPRGASSRPRAPSRARSSSRRRRRRRRRRREEEEEETGIWSRSLPPRIRACVCGGPHAKDERGTFRTSKRLRLLLSTDSPFL